VFLKALGLAEPTPAPPPVIPFTPLEEIARALQRRIDAINFYEWAAADLEQRRGRV
jgi:hypothetical protein